MYMESIFKLEDNNSLHTLALVVKRNVDFTMNQRILPGRVDVAK